MSNFRTRLCGAALALTLSAGPAVAHDVVVHAGRLIDGVDKTPRTNVSIQIHDDRIVDVEYGRRFAEAIPGARFAPVAEAGHFPQIERLAEVTALITG